jgi:hypothetical protein
MRMDFYCWDNVLEKIIEDYMHLRGYRMRKKIFSCFHGDTFYSGYIFVCVLLVASMLFMPMFSKWNQIVSPSEFLHTLSVVIMCKNEVLQVRQCETLICCLLTSYATYVWTDKIEVCAIHSFHGLCIFLMILYYNEDTCDLSSAVTHTEARAQHLRVFFR